MELNEFEYISTIADPNRRYTGISACWAIASDLISGALSLDRTVLGYEGHYLSYSKSFNIGNDSIIIDVSLDTIDVDNTIEIIIIKDNEETPDNEKERVHYLGERKFNNCKENTLLYSTIASVIKRNLTQLFNERNKKYCKVLSEVYENDFI